MQHLLLGCACCDLYHAQVHTTVSNTCLVPLASTKQLLVLSLAFFKGSFGPETCSVLCQMNQLQHLDLQGSVQADAVLMQAVGKLNTLQSLHLSRCDLIDDAALQHITSLSNLHTLNISICSKVTDVGLAAVKKLQNLTHLLAQHCRAITDSGVALLGRLEKLKVLDLSMCERVTGSGFMAFGECTQMATLSLNGCSSLNDCGLRAVGRITSLTKLDLSSCRLITDAGVGYLATLSELTGAHPPIARSSCCSSAQCKLCPRHISAQRRLVARLQGLSRAANVRICCKQVVVCGTLRMSHSLLWCATIELLCVSFQRR